MVFVAVDGKPAGLLAVADPIKATTPAALAALRARWRAHRHADRRQPRDRGGGGARRLGIADIEAEVLPERQGRVVDRLRREGRIVAMAGDGVNDAPALAAADVGIAMGTGTDVAIESAGITLLKGDLAGIVRARQLSRSDHAQHPAKLVASRSSTTAPRIPIAAGVLYPAFGILLSPVIGAAAMALSSVSVIGNALRLRRVPL